MTEYKIIKEGEGYTVKRYSLYLSSDSLDFDIKRNVFLTRRHALDTLNIYLKRTQKTNYTISAYDN
jgi:hypothetical protein